MKRKTNKIAKLLFLLPFSMKRKMNKSVRMHVRKSVEKLGVIF